MNNQIISQAVEVVLARGEGLGREEFKVAVQEQATDLADLMGITLPGFAPVVSGAAAVAHAPLDPRIDPARAIGKHSVTCAVCGKEFKLLTEKHLATHGFTRATYRRACGYVPGASLTCFELREARAKKMGEMKLWERRKNAVVEKSAKDKAKVPGDPDNL